MIHDISPPIGPALAVWPGDTPPTREVLLDRRQGANITLSTLHATVHLGAHADAFSHVADDAPSIDAHPLDPYIGPCQVVRVEIGGGRRIGVDRVDLDAVQSPRLLIATGTFPDPNRFNQDFAALEPALIVALHARGVRLIGIDTPSVDLFHSKDLPTHAALVRHRIATLEGLVLHQVPEGHYELIALPLRLVGFDASPVRAILRSLPG